MCSGSSCLLLGRWGSPRRYGKLSDIARQVRQHRAVTTRLIEGVEAAERFFLTQPMVQDVSTLDSTVSFDFTGEEEELAELLTRAVAAGLRVVEWRQRETDLEEIFMRTTRGRLQ